MNPRPEQVEETLIGGRRALSAYDVAGQAGVGVELVLDLFRSLGLPRTGPDEPTFTAADAHAVCQLAALVTRDGLSEQAVVSIARAAGHNGDRIAMWQVESLVDDLEQDRDGREARLELLTRLPVLAGPLTDVLAYAYRRQLAAVAGRYCAEFADADGPYDDQAFPLARAVGVAEVERFSRAIEGLGPAELTAFVNGFEHRVRDIVSREGGRVIKAAGDRVLFVAGDAGAGAMVACHLAEAFTTHVRPARGRPAPPRDVSMRVSVVWGRLLSKYGDVFGPPVTTAHRLCLAADAGVVLTDAGTAALLGRDPRYRVSALPPRELAGGPTTPYRVRLAVPGRS